MHSDKLGNSLVTGDYVAYASHNRLKLGTVNKLTPKMVIVMPIGKSYLDRKYPNDIIKVQDKKISLYILKNSS